MEGRKGETSAIIMTKTLLCFLLWPRNIIACCCRRLGGTGVWIGPRGTRSDALPHCCNSEIVAIWREGPHRRNKLIFCSSWIKHKLEITRSKQDKQLSSSDSPITHFSNREQNFVFIEQCRGTCKLVNFMELCKTLWMTHIIKCVNKVKAMTDK